MQMLCPAGRAGPRGSGPGYVLWPEHAKSPRAWEHRGLPRAGALLLDSRCWLQLPDGLGPVPLCDEVDAEPELPESSPVSSRCSASYGGCTSSLHQYLGVGVGEHLGYLFTGIWSMLIGVGVIQGTALPTWLGWSGVVIGAGLAVGSAEFLGPNEERGWGLAGAAIPFLYIAWSLWLLGMGIALIA